MSAPAGSRGKWRNYEVRRNYATGIQDINGPWSNAACMGYCRMAMQNAGVDECTQRKVLRELEACFDQVSVKAAQEMAESADDPNGPLMVTFSPD